MSIDQDADVAEYLLSLSRHDVRKHPRSPAVVSQQTAQAIGLDDILNMTGEQIDAALRELEKAA